MKKKTEKDLEQRHINLCRFQVERAKYKGDRVKRVIKDLSIHYGTTQKEMRRIVGEVKEVKDE